MNNETINYPFINKQVLAINYYTTIKYIYIYLNIIKKFRNLKGLVSHSFFIWKWFQPKVQR